jgi:hypothetical protein
MALDYICLWTREQISISLLTNKSLRGTAEFEPNEKVRVKSVDGSVIETHGSRETKIREGIVEIPFTFQLVSKQVDIKCDGILGRDFIIHGQI